MKQLKKMGSIVLVLIMAMSMLLPGLAGAESIFRDVKAQPDKTDWNLGIVSAATAMVQPPHAGGGLGGATSIQSLAQFTVSNEAMLRQAILDAADGDIICLINSVNLTGPLVIPAGKEITLAGEHDLVGADGQPTIQVNGTLILDGPNVTHAAGETGSGVYVSSDQKLIMLSGYISGNMASQGGGVDIQVFGIFEMLGGQIVNNMSTGHGGGVNGHITMSGDAVISGNESVNGDGGGVNGSVVMLDSAIISNNKALKGNGGAVCGSLRMADSTAVFGNQAVNGGGVYGGGYMYDQAALYENTATLNGGGMYFFAGSYTISGGSIYRNKAVNGGGIYASSCTLILSDGYPVGELPDCKVFENEASGNGGGLYLEGILTMWNGEIFANKADGDGGGVYFNYGNQDMYAGKIYGNQAGGNGGGVFTAGVFNCRSEISNNSAINGGGVYIDTNGSCDLTSGGKISDNKASGDGGGIHANGIGFISWEGIISGNTADGNGGGLYQNTLDGDIMINNSIMSENTAGGHGGGIYQGASDGRCNIEASTISGNIAGGDGGGTWIAYNDLPDLEIDENTVFSGNKARVAYVRNPIDDGTYNDCIFGTEWTSPFSQGYNNYDISYTNGTKMNVTRKWQQANGNPIAGLEDMLENRNAGETFTDAHDAGVTIPDGLAYLGFRLDTDAQGDALHLGAPNIVIGEEGLVITYVYANTIVLHSPSITIYYYNDQISGQSIGELFIPAAENDNVFARIAHYVQNEYGQNDWLNLFRDADRYREGIIHSSTPVTATDTIGADEAIVIKVIFLSQLPVTGNSMILWPFITMAFSVLLAAGAVVLKRRRAER